MGRRTSTCTHDPCRFQKPMPLPIYGPVALKKLNNFLLSIFLIRAHLIAGFTISHKVSKIVVSSFVSSVAHHTMDIIKNVFIETYSSWRILQLCLYNHVNPYSIS
jgi:hypothetical protein